MANLDRFKETRDRLASLLTAERSAEIDQETLDQISDIFQAYPDKGEAAVVPATIRVNTQLKVKTDLQPHDPHFGHLVQVVHISNVLSAEHLQHIAAESEAGAVAVHSVLDVIHRTLVARIAATEYRPRTQEVGKHDYQVHNGLVSLRREWDAPSLRDVLSLLEEAGVFAQETPDPKYGVPFVSNTATNPDMMRLWTTDACMALLWQKKRRPELVAPNLITNAGFMYHPANRRAMLRSVQDPDWYRHGGPENGIAHIFVPAPKNSPDEGLRWDEEKKVPVLESIKEDPVWFNRKRLESQALLLLELIRAVKAGAFLESSEPPLAERGRAWGFHWFDGRTQFANGNEPMNEHQKEYVIAGIQTTAMYLLAVQWNKERQFYDMAAPTVSSWEETPLPGGCASDTGFMLDAIRELDDLLFNEEYNKNKTVLDVRERLKTINLQDSEAGSAADLLTSSPFADYRERENLRCYIHAAEKKIAEMVSSHVVSAIDGIARPTPWGVKQFPERGADSSLTLLAAYHSSFDTNLARDALIRFGIVQFCEQQLMHGQFNRRYGMKRYATFSAHGGDGSLVLVDSYLNLNFNLGLEIPGLVRPMFADVVAREHRRIAEHMEKRLKLGHASSRDRIVHRAWERFVMHTASQVTAERDATSPDSMERRQQFSLPETTAQWTIGPTACLVALSVAKLGLLEYIHQYELHKEDHLLMLLSEINRSLNRFINLCLATVVENEDAEEQTVFRSDGTELPAKCNVMEAFQAVLDVNGHVRWLPGDHTLPWSASQLFRGLFLAQTAARRERIVMDEK